MEYQSGGRVTGRRTITPVQQITAPKQYSVAADLRHGDVTVMRLEPQWPSFSKRIRCALNQNGQSEDALLPVHMRFEHGSRAIG